MINSGTKFLV